MKFSINKRDFVNYVSHTNMIISNKATMQIITNILLEADSVTNTIKLTATDLNITVVLTINANVLEDGKICISAKSFADIIQALPEAVIHFVTVDDKLKINCEQSSFNLNYVDHSLFPLVPEVDRSKAVKFDCNLFKKMINNTTFAAGSEGSSQIYAGIYWNISAKEQIMAATDSKRIAEVKTFFDIDMENPIEVVVPSKPMLFIEKYLNENTSEIDLIFEDNRVVYLYENIVVMSNKYEGKYPIYSVVFRNEHKHQVIINKTVFRDAIRRVSLLATNDDANIIKFDINQYDLVIEAINSELGNAKDVLSEFSYDGDPIVFGLNSKFIQSFLSVIESDDVVLKIGKATEPIWILNNQEFENYKVRFVVMPLRFD